MFDSSGMKMISEYCPIFGHDTFCFNDQKQRLALTLTDAALFEL